MDFHLTRSPHSFTAAEEQSDVAPSVEESRKTFENWIDLIRKYATFGILPQDPIWKYAREFSQIYEIVEDDADFEPFEYERQVKLDKFLSEAILFLEKENSGSTLNQAISEAKSIKNDLGKLSKNQTIYRMSHLLGLLRKQSVSLMVKFFKSKAGKTLEFIFKEGT